MYWTCWIWCSPQSWMLPTQTMSPAVWFTCWFSFGWGRWHFGKLDGESSLLTYLIHHKTGFRKQQAKKKRGWEQGERRGSTYRTVRAEQPPEHTRSAATSTSYRPVRTVTKPREEGKPNCFSPEVRTDMSAGAPTLRRPRWANFIGARKWNQTSSADWLNVSAPITTLGPIFLHTCMKLISAHRVHYTKKLIISGSNGI